jgi:hypothetical protein
MFAPKWSEMKNNTTTILVISLSLLDIWILLYVGHLQIFDGSRLSEGLVVIFLVI